MFDLFNSESDPGVKLRTVIYLAYHSDRIPILAPFWPHYSHYVEEGVDMAVGDVFDLPRLRAALEDLPLVELYELKSSVGVPEQWQRILYDGETPQLRADGTSYSKGDWIEPLQGMEEQLGCWSFWHNLGSETDVDYFTMRMNISECLVLSMQLMPSSRTYSFTFESLS